MTRLKQDALVIRLRHAEHSSAPGREAGAKVAGPADGIEENLEHLRSETPPRA